MTVWEALAERDKQAQEHPETFLKLPIVLYNDGHTKGGIYHYQNAQGAYESCLGYSRAGTGSTVVITNDMELSVGLLHLGISPWQCWSVGDHL